jgi:hypothetical protein
MGGCRARAVLIPDDVITESGHLITDSGDQITPSERSDDRPL